MREVAISRIDQKILQYADSKSPEEISRLLNGVITPERVAAQAQKLLKAKRWLTEAQEEDIVLLKLRNILTQLEDQFMDLDNARVQLQLLKEIGNRIDKRRAATQVDLETYDLNVARAMTTAYSIALNYIRGAFRDEIDPDRWDEVATEALAHARDEAMKNVIEE